MEKSFVLGLDIGITSIGWSIIDDINGQLVDMGVHMFEKASSAQDCRNFRSARRNQRHKNWRKCQLRNAFCDFGIITPEEMEQKGYLQYTTNNESVIKPKDETVHHLRLRALKEQVSSRELFLCLYNISQSRGHFLQENIDFLGSEKITVEDFKVKFYDLVEEFISITDREALDVKLLSPIFNGEKIKSNEIRSIIKKETFTESEEQDAALEQFIKLICGYKADLERISDDILINEGNNKFNIVELIKKDALNPTLDAIVELYELLEVSKILETYDYVCEYNVQKLDEVKKMQKLEHSDSDTYKEYKKAIQDKMNVKEKNNKLRVIRNIDNKFPNGLYLKEARDILRTQQKFDSRITDNFIEVCLSILSARIPYYIGPLSETAKNAWIVKNGNFKYSYDYSKNHAVNEAESIKCWKNAMRSRCSYLPECFALPKGSFIAETFSILNEMNILFAVDKNENEYYLTREDKIRVFDELFIRNPHAVTYKEVSELLNLSYFGPKNGNGSGKFKNTYTLYRLIVEYIPELKLHSILEIFDEKSKMETIEDIVLNINLFDEEISRKNYFIDNGWNVDIASKLSRLKSNGFYAFSKEFILETAMNHEGQSLLEEMFEDNSSEYKNEQMTLISMACDQEGNPIHFEANKYVDKIKETGHLSIDLLIEDGKPFIPISRSVIRALNECFKLYEEIIGTYGVPKRVVIETARELKDMTQEKEVSACHFEKMSSLYSYLEKQLKDEKHKNMFCPALKEDWEQIATYLPANKKKIELYLRQNGRDMISGDPIDLNHLEEYEMDHILPRGFGDNSMDNFMLILKGYNTKKGDRIPLEYIEQENVTSKNGKIITTQDFTTRVLELFSCKLISEKKKNQLLLQSTEDAMGFINRNLVDTRYIIKELMSILSAYNQVHDYKTTLVALKASFTSAYRQAFGMRKNRDVGDQHHAHDASIVAIADMVLQTYYPYYDKQAHAKNHFKNVSNVKYEGYQTYQSFLQSLASLDRVDKSERDKFNNFIRYAYYVRFKNYPNDYDSLISQVQRTVPLYSMKVEKNYKGKLFDATILTQENRNRNSPLDILGVNNDLHVFSFINCAAVDFYKVKDKKGKRKHIAIHIPKVIIDSDGNINKKQYIDLIQKFYKEPALIDENGELKEQCFRMRVFKNDLIYNTQTQTIQKFNIGSIANKKLEMKHINIFSYCDIYDRVNRYRKKYAKEFDFKMSNINPNGSKSFKDYSIQQLIDFGFNHLMDVHDRERYQKAIYNILSKETIYQTFLEKMAFLDLIVNRENTWPKIIGQYQPKIGAIDSEAQYIKIKSSILGIRFGYNEKGTLMISGPKKAPYKFSKIKKEKFSWKITKGMVL